MAVLNNYSLKILIIFLSSVVLMFSILQFSDLILLPVIFTIATCLFSYELVRERLNDLSLKISLFVLLMLISQFISMPIEFKIFLILIWNMTFDLLLGYQWYSHFPVNWILLYGHIQSSLPYLVVEIVVFALFELSFKRSWVIQETAK